jgi:hypothetical protein
MASNFITQQEVVDLAFEKDIRTGYIKDSKIEAAELKYMRPALTETLFNRLNQSNEDLNEKELALKALIKKALAFYVGFLVIPSISLQVTNRGTQLPTGQNSNTGSDKQRGQIRDTYLSMADTFKDEAVKYIEDNIESFREYYEAYKSSSNKIKRRGGIIFG